MKKLPPTNTLRTLEAAVRLQSFTRAANELGVTQSAVSHQIKDLELYLGSELFLRKSRKCLPTHEGLSLAESIRDGFDTISKVLDSIKSAKPEDKLMISLLPGFAVKWLFPRLINFDQLHPNITVSLIAQPDLADLLGGEADLAIRYGRGNYPGLTVTKLHEETMFPVCSPQYIASSSRLKKPKDLARHTLLWDSVRTIDGVTPNWDSWFSLAGCPNLQTAETRQYGQSNMVIQAALAGRGVALGRSLLVADDIACGRLVIPFGPKVLSGFSYYLAFPKAHREQDAINKFAAWIKQEFISQGDHL